MKKLLFLLFAPFILAQSSNIPMYGDTTDLKASTHCGVVLLEQYGGSTWDVTGGGLFHCIDSTYSEGSHAFDHSRSGKQWARIGAFGTMTATTLTSTTLTTTGAIQVGTTISLDSTVSCGIDSFATTAATDTVVISGATVDDIYIVTSKYTGGVDQQDVLQYVPLDGKLAVIRMASGESGLAYAWIRIKNH